VVFHTRAKGDRRPDNSFKKEACDLALLRRGAAELALLVRLRRVGNELGEDPLAHVEAMTHFARALGAARSGKPDGHLESASNPNLLAAFRQRLHDLGYVEGQNLFIERRYGEGREERLPQRAEELVQFGVDVIFAIGPPQALAAAKATNPIVFVGVATRLQWVW
jgi:hypothetical protein